MLVIHPDECIDCGVCEPNKPLMLLFQITQDDGKWLELNSKYSNTWSNIAVKDITKIPEDAEEYAGVENKFEKYFSDKPGE